MSGETICALAQPHKVVLNLLLTTWFDSNLILYLTLCSPERLAHAACILKNSLCHWYFFIQKWGCCDPAAEPWFTIRRWEDWINCGTDRTDSVRVSTGPSRTPVLKNQPIAVPFVVKTWNPMGFLQWSWLHHWSSGKITQNLLWKQENTPFEKELKFSLH